MTIRQITWPSVREYRDAAQERLNADGLTKTEQAACQDRVNRMNELITNHERKDASNYTQDELMSAWNRMFPITHASSPGHASRADGADVNSPSGNHADGASYAGRSGYTKI